MKDDQSDDDEEDDESKEENNFRNFKYDDSSDSDSDLDSSESEDEDSTKSSGLWGSLSSGDSNRKTSAKDFFSLERAEGMEDIIQKRVEDAVETSAKEESDSYSVSLESSGDHTYESDGSESRLPDEISGHSSSSRNVAKDLKEDTTEDDMIESDAESNTSDNSQDVAIRANYRKDVETLIRLVLPNQLSKVDAMMARFKGREPELIATLQNMHHRSTKKMRGETSSNYSESRSEDMSQGSREVSEDGDSASRSYDSDSAEEESYYSEESESYYSSQAGESRSFAEDSQDYDSYYEESYAEEDDDTASDGD